MAREIPRMLEPYGALLDERALERLIAVIDDPLPAALRVNPLKTDPAEAARLWRQQYGWELHAVPFCPTGWQLAEPSELLSRTVTCAGAEHPASGVALHLLADTLSHRR